MIWFVADTHYSHKNIVNGVSQWTNKSGCRPFNTLKEHDDWIIDCINMHVNRADVLYHLGDWSFGGKDKVEEFYGRLNVRDVCIIKGNHDHNLNKFKSLFISIENYSELQLDGANVVLCHYPLESWNNMERGAYHLHGHVHGNSRQLAGRYDVGIEGSMQWDNFTCNAVGLISLDQLKTLPTSNVYRHPGEIHGGNKFGTN